MTDLSQIAEQLFNKLRGRFPSITIGDEAGNVTNVPTDARFFDFDYKDNGSVIGKVSCSLDPEKVTVIYSDNLVGDENQTTRNSWYEFLQGLRQFSRSRMLGFDVRNVNKNNNTRRDYQFLAANKIPESIDLQKYIEDL